MVTVEVSNMSRKKMPKNQGIKANIGRWHKVQLIIDLYSTLV